MSACPRCGGILRADWPDTPNGHPMRLTGQQHLLIDTLELAVPMWMDLLADMDDTEPAPNHWYFTPGQTERARHIWWWAKTAIDPICTKGDNLQYGVRGKPKPTRADRAEIAETFNYLASALAALAYGPGGVSFAGRHWCTTTEEAAA